MSEQDQKHMQEAITNYQKLHGKEESKNLYLSTTKGTSEHMTDDMYVTYCGLYCDLCGSRGRIPQRAKNLWDSMAEEGYELWGEEIPQFMEFWTFLTDLCSPEKACPGCQKGGGPPFCSIRKCCKERGHKICAFCKKYPCHRIIALAKGYPTLIADGERIRDIGLDAWIEEQKKRVKTGFVYADIRCYPYSVPED